VRGWVIPPEQAKELWNRFEFVFTPEHGSWLNMAGMHRSLGCVLAFQGYGVCPACVCLE